MLDYFQYLFIKPDTVYQKTPKNKEQTWEPEVVPSQEEISFVNTLFRDDGFIDFEEKTGYIWNNYMHVLDENHKPSIVKLSVNHLQNLANNMY